MSSHHACTVIPAQAGIQCLSRRGQRHTEQRHGIPACAGMTLVVRGLTIQ
jgi:hypothetical protein